MIAIETQNIAKTYRTRIKAEGLGASFRALLKPADAAKAEIFGQILFLSALQVSAALSVESNPEPTYRRMSGAVYRKAF